MVKASRRISFGAAGAASLIAAQTLLVPGPARAERLTKCPVESLDQADIAAAVSAAPSCAQAYEIMNVCRANASGDVALADIVIQQCEKVFLPNLEPAASQAYKAARDACARRFAHRDGTMSASFQATCEAGVAVVFAHRADLAAMRPRGSPYGGLAPVQH